MLRKKLPSSALVLFFLMLFLCPQSSWAQNVAAPSSSPGILTQMSVLALFSILPFAVMLLTSYVKVVIVLSLLRNALGVQQAPPNQVLNGIALLMDIYVMAPTFLAMYKAGK